MESKKRIIGIKLKGNGIKGMDVVYTQEHEKNGKVWHAIDTTERKVPVGEDLENVIKAFRYYLLDIYGYDMDNVNVADVLVEAVDFDGGAVRIIGKLKILNGISTVKLDTKYVGEEHEYDKMDEVVKLVGQLKGEVEKYLEGKSVMSDSQLVMNFYKGKGKFDEVEFAGMSDEEKKIKATEILEKMGSLVIHNDEMGGDKFDSAEVINVEDNVVMQKGKPNLTIGEKVNSVSEVIPSFEAKAPELNLEEVLVAEDEDGEEVFMVAPIKSV